MTSKSPGLTLLEAHNFNRWAAKNPDQLLCYSMVKRLQDFDTKYYEANLQ